MRRRVKRWLSLLSALLLLMPGWAAAEAGLPVSVTAPEEPVRPWGTALIRFTLPEDGPVDLTLSDRQGNQVFPIAGNVAGVAGQNTLFWNATYEHQPAPEGIWMLTLTASSGATARTPVTVVKPDAPEEPELKSETGFTPSTTSPYAGEDAALNYWTLPMDIRDEAAVWHVLTAPITVVDTGDGEKAQVTLRREPSADSEGVGVVTCVTQGVHVLDRGAEWSLIECYSSSFYDSKILNWNALVQGYVPTRFLREDVPNQEMGLVIDKLSQRLYLFMEGRLYSTLAVSTGLSNPRQPYNETRSGEFLLTSKVGEFSSDNLRCGLAIRFNSGDLLHEVPYMLTADGTKNYGLCERKLGTKASHGCIRVQRRKTPEGVNMAWFWEHLKRNSKTRLLIWEDWQGRQLEIPAEDTLLYYNPKNTKYYHSQPTCLSQGVGAEMKSFPYERLDSGIYERMKWCEWCAPVPRKAQIEALNAKYAPGGDHDPVMTAAREKCPRPLKR